LITLIVTLIGCAPLSAGTTGNVDQSPTAPPVGTEIGETAPDIALHNLNGETVRLSDFRGQPVMINFWAVWCHFCLIEMPDMQAAYDRYQDQGFVILGIDVREDRARVSSFVEELGLTFPILLDSEGHVTQRYQVRGLPTSYFVDAEGVIVGTRVGPVDAAWINEHLAKVGIE
jgi:peroxiredoxin